MTASVPSDSGREGRLRRWLRKKWLIGLSGALLIFAAGAAGLSIFNTALELTNREAFCISCHEMKDNVYEEYRTTVHFQNRTGVRATCPDCHVPKEFGPKMLRKLQASKELWGKITGSIDTREKFEGHRARLAQNEWRRMKANDSQECRNCHKFDSMDYAEQNRRSAAMHQQGFGDGMTCIDCHKGIAHNLPAIDQHVGVENEGGVSPDVMHPPLGGKPDD
ncbi:MAG: NapC/NirT family cytochrome c [Rhodocyclaceae bacterium]